MLALLKYNLLSLWVRRMTTLATTGGIALVVFVLGASQMLATGMRQTISSAGSADQAIVMEHDARTEEGSRVDQAAAGLVAAAPGVKRNGASQAMIMQESVAHLMLQSLVDPSRISTLQVRGVSANVFELRPEAITQVTPWSTSARTAAALRGDMEWSCPRRVSSRSMAASL